MPSAVTHVIIVSRDENPQGDNQLDCPSFESFHAQLDCKITKVLKKWGETHDYLLCFSLRSSVRLVFHPKLLLCSSRFMCVNNRTEHCQGFSRSLSRTPGVGEGLKRDHMVFKGERRGIRRRQ